MFLPTGIPGSDFSVNSESPHDSQASTPQVIKSDDADFKLGSDAPSYHLDTLASLEKV
jgi:hypothetical protein